MIIRYFQYTNYTYISVRFVILHFVSQIYILNNILIFKNINRLHLKILRVFCIIISQFQNNINSFSISLIIYFSRKYISSSKLFYSYL